MGKKNRLAELLVVTLHLSDIAIINFCFLAAMGLETFLSVSSEPFISFWTLVVYNILWVAVAFCFHLYRPSTSTDITNIIRNTYKTYFAQLALFVAYIYFIFYHKPGTSYIHRFLLINYGLSFMMLTLSRLFLTFFSKNLAKKANLRRKCAIIGRSDLGHTLSKFFREHKALYNYYGFLDEYETDGVWTPSKLSANYKEYIDQAVANSVDEVYAIHTAEDTAALDGLFSYANSQCVRIHIVNDVDLYTGHEILTHEEALLDGKLHVNALRSEPLTSLYNRFRKRVFDILFSGFVMVFILSWLYPILALCIKLSSSGPVLFKQKRSGRDNKPFYCYKFRSMKVNKDSDSMQATKNDMRVTKIGAFMRKTSLDELPQFLNVFKGEMSIVGPRPHMLKHTEMYQQLIDQYLVRQFLKPGITGWAQVSGYRGETKELYQMEARVQHDIWYMENWSLMLDVRIIFMTVANIIKGEPEAY